MNKPIKVRFVKPGARPPPQKKLTYEEIGLRHEMSQFYWLKGTFEELFGRPMYMELKENTDLADWKKASNKLLDAIRFSIRSSVHTADDEWFASIEDAIQRGRDHIKLARTTTEGGSCGITSVKNLQIVNGGQTTASILYANDRSGADLSRVQIAMTLSVVSGDRIDEIVPKISRFANTQNKISETDFFSSHAFHQKLEQISRRLMAPPKPGFLSGQSGSVSERADSTKINSPTAHLPRGRNSSMNIQRIR